MAKSIFKTLQGSIKRDLLCQVKQLIDTQIYAHNYTQVQQKKICYIKRIVLIA